jgi:hypothetical protein
VAIKQLRTDGFSPKILTKFVQEAKISCALCSHPNILTTFGIWMNTRKEEETMIVMGIFLFYPPFSFPTLHALP